MTYPKPSLYSTAYNIAGLAGTSEPLFPAVAWDGLIERVIHNPNASGDLWWRPLITGAEAAAANGAGSFRLQPGETVSLEATNAVVIIGTAANKVTAYERGL